MNDVEYHFRFLPMSEHVQPESSYFSTEHEWCRTIDVQIFRHIRIVFESRWRYAVRFFSLLHGSWRLSTCSWATASTSSLEGDFSSNSAAFSAQEFPSWWCPCLPATSLFPFRISLLASSSGCVQHVLPGGVYFHQCKHPSASDHYRRRGRQRFQRYWDALNMKDWEEFMMSMKLSLQLERKRWFAHGRKDMRLSCT